MKEKPSPFLLLTLFVVSSHVKRLGVSIDDVSCVWYHTTSVPPAVFILVWDWQLRWVHSQIANNSFLDSCLSCNSLFKNGCMHNYYYKTSVVGTSYMIVTSCSGRKLASRKPKLDNKLQSMWLLWEWLSKSDVKYVLNRKWDDHLIDDQMSTNLGCTIPYNGGMYRMYEA